MCFEAKHVLTDSRLDHVLRGEECGGAHGFGHAPDSRVDLV